MIPFFLCAAFPDIARILCSPPRAELDDSSSGSLDSSDVNSVPPAVSPCEADDAEVAPRQASGQEEMVLEEPQGNPPDPRSKGDETPQELQVRLCAGHRAGLDSPGPRWANSFQEK